MAENNKLEKTSNLLRLFNFAIRDNNKATKNSDKVTFTRPSPKPNGDMGSIKDKLSPSARNVFDYWEATGYVSRQSYEQRTKLWQDMDLGFFNSAVIGKAVKYTAGESLQADLNTMPIQVEAKRDQKNFIVNFFDEISLYAKIYQLAEDIVLYGNALWMLSFSKNGTIDEIIHTDIYDLVDRIEFNARQIEKQLQMRNGTFMKLLQIKRVDSLIKNIKNGEQFSADYKSYLLGYQIGDQVIPPWRAIHFRNASSRDPFYPFGMPFYINSIAPYRAYDAGLSLQIAARGARFPIDKYSLNLGEGTTNPTTKLQRVTEFINQWENSGMRAVPKEGVGIGERIVTIEGLIAYDQITPQIDLGKVDDLYLMKEDLIESTDIPVSFFIADKGSFGNSGISLSQQSQPFRRRVYVVQSIIMQGISEMVKINMIQSGKYALKDIDFFLSMPYPESQISGDMISSQRDLLGLANDVVDAFADKVGGTQASDLPIEVIRQIYSKILPYDQTTIDSWINQIEKDRNKTAKDLENKFDNNEVEKPMELSYNQKHNKAIIPMTEIYSRLNINKKEKFNEVLEETIHNRKKKKVREGVMSGRHYFSNLNKADNGNFFAEKLVEFDKQIAKDILKENSIKPISSKSLNESNKYVFGESEINENEFLKLQEKLNEPLIEDEIKEIYSKMEELKKVAEEGEYKEILKEQILRTGRWKQD